MEIYLIISTAIGVSAGTAMGYFLGSKVKHIEKVVIERGKVPEVVKVPDVITMTSERESEMDLD